MSPRNRLPAALALAVVVAALASNAPASATDCRSSSPASGAFSVRLCISEPASDAILTGDVTVAVSVEVTPGRPVKTVQFLLDGSYVLTDYQEPFRFALPTPWWPDGPHQLKARAVIDAGTSLWTSRSAGVPVVVSNPAGPPSITPFVPRVPDVPEDQPLLVAAVGDGASGRAQSGTVVREIAGWDPDLFLYLGDVYGRGTIAEFSNWYGTSSRYGRFRSITNPIPGNHEYESDPLAAPYFWFWGAPPHRYSYDAGGWHFVHVDSSEVFGQVTSGTAQFDWLRDDLRGAGDCVVAVFHEPAWDRGGHESSGTRLLPLWRLLVREGVDVVLNGHSHNYMRWAPMNADGEPTVGGTTEVVVGTGGHFLYRFGKVDDRVAASTDRHNGALLMSLSPGSADLSFVTTNGSTFDQDDVSCSPKVDQEAPTAPTLSGVADGAAADLSWIASTDDVGVTGYRVERDGIEVATVGGTTLTFDDTGLESETAYDYVVFALDAAGHETASNVVQITTGQIPS